MQLLKPDIGLLLWAVINILFFALLIWAIISLVKIKTSDNQSKLMWSLIIVFVPLAGPILFLTIGKNQLTKKAI